MILEQLKDLYKDKYCYIVGKGASLEFLSQDHFINHKAPVICLNDSIAIVQDLDIDNPIYSLQKDGNVEHMVKPYDDVVLIVQETEGYSRDWYPEHEKRLLIDPVKDFGFDLPQTMAIRMAIALSQYMGCNHINFMCCDVLSNKEKTETFIVSERRSKQTSASEWYIKSRPYVINDIRNIPHVFITPHE